MNIMVCPVLLILVSSTSIVLPCRNSQIYNLLTVSNNTLTVHAFIMHACTQQLLILIIKTSVTYICLHVLCLVVDYYVDEFLVLAYIIWGLIFMEFNFCGSMCLPIHEKLLYVLYQEFIILEVEESV